MELGGKKVPRGSALRGSSSASSADVRSNHGGRCVSVASSEDRGPRRFFASFSSYYTELSASRSVPLISQKDSLPYERFRGTTSAPSGYRYLSLELFLRLPGR